MLEFGPVTEINRIRDLVDELFKYVLYDEEPLFISDEATLWAVAAADVADVLDRCRSYYGVQVTLEETQQPLWKLLRMLEERRRAAKTPST